MHDDVEASGWEPGDLEADPCDRMVELELPPGGRLTFLSDLHFTERGPLADFQAGDALHQLLRSVRGHAGPVILVLGGDVLDLLQLSGPRDKAVSRALRGEDARRLGEELHRLAERPDATIVYLVGNHDASLAWDGRGRRRVAHQLAADHVGLHLRVRLHGPEGGEVILVAEHGDALDLYNRRSDPFDPLDSPAGDHIVTELVRRMDTATERRPELALDQVNNVRPTAMVPTWMVANFFYRYLSRALQDVALPLTGLFLVLHLPIVATLAAGLLGRLGPVGELSGRLAGWAVLVGAVDLVLVGVMFAFVGRTLRQAVSVYGGSPEELASGTGTDANARQEGAAALLARRDPAARVLLHGHTHQASFSRLDPERVSVDSGCWIRALVPVRAWLGLPPVFVPTYPCTWIEVDTSSQGVEVRLWERAVAVPRRLFLTERLLARGKLPTAEGQPPRVVAGATLAYAATSRAAQPAAG
jgi:UDP-2,3-diacylglucosamine pyrophosphatase LpxH